MAPSYSEICSEAAQVGNSLLHGIFSSLQLLGLPDVDDDAFEEYNADVEEEEPEADHQQMGVSQQ